MSRCNQAYAEAQITRIHHEIEIATRRLELEKRNLAKRDQELRRTRNELEILKYGRARPTTAPRSTPRTVSSTPRTPERPTPRPLTARSAGGVRKVVIESRLEASLKQLNKIKHANALLVKTIDDKRSSSLQLKSVWRKLQDDLRAKQREIQAITVAVAEAKEVLKEAQTKRGEIKKILETERKDFKGNVGRIRDELKDKDKEKKEYEIKVTRDHKNAAREYLIADEEESFSEERFMQKIFKLCFLNCIQRRNIKQHVKNIEVFEQAFATIKSTTGISDIKEIVKIFVKLEERNFSLLSYTNELSQEIEHITCWNNKLAIDEKNRADCDEEYQALRSDAVTHVSAELERSLRATETVEASHRTNESILDEIIPQLMVMVKCIDKVDAFNEASGIGGEHGDIYKKPKGGFTEKTLLDWLEWFERFCLLCRDYLPASKPGVAARPFSYTVGAEVKTNLQPKKPHVAGNATLLRPVELPSNERYEDDEEDRVLSMAEVKQRVIGQISRHPKKRGPMPSAIDHSSHAVSQFMAYNDIVMPTKSVQSADSDEEMLPEEEEPGDAELDRIFLKRYKMSRAELKSMADKMRIQLSNLCYLKQEFDTYDQDQSGFIDMGELSLLLQKLGENLSEAELAQAFKELDADQSGEVEFFEFVQWFTSED